MVLKGFLSRPKVVAEGPIGAAAYICAGPKNNTKHDKVNMQHFYNTDILISCLLHLSELVKFENPLPEGLEGR